MQGSPEVVLVSYSAFKSNPPNQFRVNRDGVENLQLPDSYQVTIISDKPELSNTPKASVVNSIAELDAFRNQILNRPLLLLATCGKHVPHGQRLNRRGEYLSMRDPEWWIQWENAPWRNPYARWGTEHMTSMYEERFVRPEFVVSVNTSHPNIRRVLDEGFRKAEDMLNEKASFAVEFNFNPMILRWWKTQGVKRYDSMECLELTAAVGANFVVTNCSAVNHFFDCHAAWCACWPFYLLFAVPYKIWRHAFQGIRDIPVTMEGKAISANIIFSNYSLADLHIGFILSNQPSLNAEGVQLSTVPLTNGIPSHILNSPPLQGPLGNSRFKANQECIR